MRTVLGQQLTRQLFEPGIEPRETTGMLDELREYANYATRKTAELWGTEIRPVPRLYYDEALRGNPNILAYNMDPQEVAAMNPRLGEQLKREVGSDPIIALNPRIVYVKDKDFRRDIAHHEGGHTSQPAKMMLKSIYARTDRGMLPLGEMFLEGSNEWALEQLKMRAPSTYMKRYGNKEPVYSVFKDFIYDLEDAQKGITRLTYKTARRGGPDAVIRLFESNPKLGRVVDKYAAKLLGMQMN